MNVEMHDGAIKKLKGLIKTIIMDSCSMKKEVNHVYDMEPYEKIAKELNNRKTNYEIDPASCFMILHKIRLKNKVQKSNSESLDNCVDMVFNAFAKTPFECDIQIHFNKVKHFKSKQCFNTLSAITGKMDSSLIFPNEHEKYLIINLKTKGFYTGAHPESFIKSAIRDVNVLIFLLITNGVLSDNLYEVLTPSYFSMNEINKSMPVEVNVINTQFPFFSTNAKLPASIENYYSILTVNDGYSELALYNAFDVANSVVEDNSRELLRIKSAIDWLVNSIINEDKTMAFVQACMGLESIFGDDDYEGGLTTILSDRCAYLIGKNIKDRAEIKKTFREIYQIRSKIIHGVRNCLSEKEQTMLYMARQFLRKSILKELGNLELLSLSQQR
ncbi:TPA: hypothetical protein RVT83_001829 [Escherichia coli]|nr:hypothetical protein HVZ30_09630 [Escherichia coli]QML60354.1 hypothetical protein HVX31_09500 [Escherichia coli]HEA3677126.1 hypothetical protein [Escherichia coli]